MRERAMGTWCRGTELNCRHQPFQGCALPTELPRHGSGQEERGTVTGSSEKNQAAWSVTFREPPKQIVAEREGFEPSVEVLPLRRFSKPLPSATRPPLRPVLSSHRGVSLVRRSPCGVNISRTPGKPLDCLGFPGRRHVRIALDQCEARPSAEFL